MFARSHTCNHVPEFGAPVRRRLVVHLRKELLLDRLAIVHHRRGLLLRQLSQAGEARCKSARNAPAPAP